ncbi:MAG: transcription antitermination factor NusB [Casimicrobiaceae bacterium]
MPSPTPTRTTPRRRARELVLQGLYQRQLAGNAIDFVRAQLVDGDAYARADQAFFDELWAGVTRDFDPLLAAIAPLLDRPLAELSPIERSIIAIGAWELANRLDTPYKVVINEAVELAKSFGATGGHKFVNGVLDKHAASVRAQEIAARVRERTQ